MPRRNVTAGATNINHPENPDKSRTGTHLSTNIFIAIDGLPVAAVMQMDITEARDIKPIAEVGHDGFIDSAPSSSTKISGTCKRTRFDGKRIAEAFRRGFVHVSAQRVPFDIQIHDLIRGDGDEEIITTLENVWISQISYTYNADDFIIVDTMNWQAEAINSVRTGGDSAIFDRETVFLNQFEEQADVGQYRGALDAAGLINAFQGGGANNS